MRRIWNPWLAATVAAGLASLVWLGGAHWVSAGRLGEQTLTVAVGEDSQVWLGTSRGLYRVTLAATEAVKGFSGGVRQILVDPGNPSQMYALMDTGHLLVSQEAGKTWSATRSHGLPRAPIRTVAYDPSGPIRLGAVVSGRGYYQSDAFGDTWLQLGEQDIPTATSMVISPLDPRVVLVGSEQGLHRSFNQGARFDPEDVEYPWSLRGTVYNLAVAGDRSSILAAAQDGVFRSTDGGRSWSPVAETGLPDVAAVAIDPWKSQIFVAASRSGRVAISMDRGQTWKLTR